MAAGSGGSVSGVGALSWEDKYNNAVAVAGIVITHMEESQRAMTSLMSEISRLSEDSTQEVLDATRVKLARHFEVRHEMSEAEDCIRKVEREFTGKEGAGFPTSILAEPRVRILGNPIEERLHTVAKAAVCAGKQLEQLKTFFRKEKELSESGSFRGDLRNCSNSLEEKYTNAGISSTSGMFKSFYGEMHAPYESGATKTRLAGIIESGGIFPRDKTGAAMKIIADRLPREMQERFSPSRTLASVVANPKTVLSGISNSVKHVSQDFPRKRTDVNGIFTTLYGIIGGLRDLQREIESLGGTDLDVLDKTLRRFQTQLNSMKGSRHSISIKELAEQGPELLKNVVSHFEVIVEFARAPKLSRQQIKTLDTFCAGLGGLMSEWEADATRTLGETNPETAFTFWKKRLEDAQNKLRDIDALHSHLTEKSIALHSKK